jgi:hypothetical protein
MAAPIKLADNQTPQAQKSDRHCLRQARKGINGQHMYFIDRGNANNPPARALLLSRIASQLAVNGNKIGSMIWPSPKSRKTG